MELGCDGVLVNTAIAKAKKPFEMAQAMKFAVIAGRKSYTSGRILKTLHGSASTTNKGVASFDTANFTVTSGAVAVTTIDGGSF